MDKLRKMQETLDLVKVSRSKESYYEYLRYVYPMWKDGKHLLFMIKKIEEFLNGVLLTKDGKECKFLLLSCPPQVGKSMTITEALPSYVLGKRMFGDRRYERIIALAYGDSLATKFGKRNRTKVEEFGKKIFGIELDPNSKSATDFDIVNSNSSMITRGILAGVTGNAGDLIIVDDPHKNREDAFSELSREKIWDEFLASVESRLSAKGKVIVIHTRWHPDDLIGRILNNKAFRSVYYNFPLEAEENDLLGRKVGASLFPEIGKDDEWLQEKKAIYMEKEGKATWYALYQGRPAIEGGNIVKRDWFQFYDKLPPMGYVMMSVDATFKDGKNSDFVSIQVWGKSNNKMYLIDKMTERMGFVATTHAIRTMLSKHSSIKGIIIEDKANGSAIIDTLRRELTTPIMPVNPKGGKIARFEAISMHIEAGKVYLPSNKMWTHDFIEQCVAFPAVPHDDDVDSMTQAISRLIRYRAEIISGEELEKREKHQEIYGNMAHTYGGARATRAFMKY